MRRRPRFVITHVTYKALWYPYIDCLWNKLPALGVTDSGMVELLTLLFEMLLAPTTQVILKNGFQGSAMEVGIGTIVRQPPNWLKPPPL